MIWGDGQLGKNARGSLESFVLDKIGKPPEWSFVSWAAGTRTFIAESSDSPLGKFPNHTIWDTHIVCAMPLILSSAVYSNKRASPSYNPFGTDVEFRADLPDQSDSRL